MNEAPFYRRYAERPCAVCGSPVSKLLFRQTFSEMSSGSLLQGYDVVVCAECGFGFADHIPDQAEFDAHYRDMSKYEYQDQGGQETEYDLARFRAIADTIGAFLPGYHARLLDVGCATGRLLALFKEKGYGQVVGLDPSPVCAQAADKLYGIRVLTVAISEIAEVLVAEQPFDCVILSGVLEHLRDIEPALLQMRDLLVKDGLVFIEVPDATDFARWPDAPFQEFSTEHINFFSTTSLTNLMRRYGFVQVICEQLLRDQTLGYCHAGRDGHLSQRSRSSSRRSCSRCRNGDRAGGLHSEIARSRRQTPAHHRLARRERQTYHCLGSRHSYVALAGNEPPVTGQRLRVRGFEPSLSRPAVG